MSVPMSQRGPSGGADDISIAFTKSQYSTPYTDQTIPGSTPGHRLRKLGRQHQPPDVLYNHLHHNLVAHGQGTVATHGTAWEGNADHPVPPGGNYVLHSKNGGRRHFDEPLGHYSEATWQPSRRIIFPLEEHDRRRVPQRRGRGVYNTADTLIHPDAEEALQQREAAEQRQRERGGKARVGGPPDHSIADLGMVDMVYARSRATTTCAAPPPPSSSSVQSSVVKPQQHQQQQQEGTAAATASLSADEREVTDRRRLSAGNALLPSTGMNVPPPRGSAAEADAVAEYHRSLRMQKTLQERKAGLAGAATRTADVQAVRELPNW